MSVDGMKFMLLVPGHDLSWYQADSLARGLGAGWQLATVNSSSLYRKLIDLIRPLTLGCFSWRWKQEPKVWIGGRQEGRGQLWEWRDGALVRQPLWGMGVDMSTSGLATQCMMLGGTGWEPLDCRDHGGGTFALLAQETTRSAEEDWPKPTKKPRAKSTKNTTKKPFNEPITTPSEIKYTNDSLLYQGTVCKRRTLTTLVTT